MSFAKKVESILGFTQQNRIVWGVSIGHAFSHLFPATFYLLLPFIKDELGLNYTEMGLLVSFRFIGGTVTNFPSGMIADLIGRHHLILTIALVWVGIPYLFVGISDNYTILALCMVFIGIGNNLLHPAAMSMLRDAYPSKRGWAMGWNSSAGHMGDALGPFMSGILLAWLTWRSILMGISIPGLGVALVVWWLLKPSQNQSALSCEKGGNENKPREKKQMSLAEYCRGFGKLLVDPKIFLLSLINGIRSLTQSGLSTFLPSFFMNLLQLSPWLSGVYMTIVQVAGIIAAPVSGRISDRHGRKRVVTAALLSTSVATFLLAFLNIPWLFVVFLGMMGFFLYSLAPVLFAWTMEVAPKELGGSVIGIQFTFQTTLAALAPLLGGWIADRWGLMYTFYFLAAVMLLSNLLVVFLKEPTRIDSDLRTESKVA